MATSREWAPKPGKDHFESLQSFMDHFNVYKKPEDPYWTPAMEGRHEFVTLEDPMKLPEYGTDIDPNSTVVVKIPPKRLLRNRDERSANPNVSLIEGMALASQQQHQETLRKLQEFSIQTNMVVVQENGQRSAGPPRDYDGPLPPKRSEVFVGHLHRGLNEIQLHQVFSKIGKVYEIRLMLDFPGTNRGFCYVKYFNPIDACNAVAQLDNYAITPNSTMGVMMSVNDCRIFVSGLPRIKSRMQILREMRRVTEGVTDVILHEPIGKEGIDKNRGYAYIDYTKHKQSAMARRRLVTGRATVFNQKVLAELAQPEPDNPTLRVCNISSDASERDLRNLFNFYGIQGVIRINRADWKRNQAYINFKSKEQADAARLALNGYMLKGSAMEVKWAKPKYEDGSTYAYTRKMRMAKQCQSQPQPEMNFSDHLQTWHTSAALTPTPMHFMPLGAQNPNQWQQNPGNAFHQNWELPIAMNSYPPVPPVEWSRNTMDCNYYGHSVPMDSFVEERWRGQQSDISPSRMNMTLEDLAPGAGRPIPTPKNDFVIGEWKGPEFE